jgi:hypothetical protein
MAAIPHKCIFESYAIERFPEGQEPKTNWVYAEPTGEKWGSVLAQDFSNMAAVQKGMRSRGFRGPLAQSASGAQGHQFPPQSGEVHGHRRASLLK